MQDLAAMAATVEPVGPTLPDRVRAVAPVMATPSTETQARAIDFLATDVVAEQILHARQAERRLSLPLSGLDALAYLQSNVSSNSEVPPELAPLKKFIDQPPDENLIGKILADPACRTIPIVAKLIWLALPCSNLDCDTLEKRARKVLAQIATGWSHVPPKDSLDLVCWSVLMEKEDREPADKIAIPEEVSSKRRKDMTFVRQQEKWDKQAAKRALKTGRLPNDWLWCAYDPCRKPFRPGRKGTIYCSSRCKYRGDQNKPAAGISHSAVSVTNSLLEAA